ncbi:hypothetical protein PYW08_001328 [Mythimna loreyi]|uniref:Uncharacterized protein n=1 Tax=Mythimna loreyi TaxID=667449 RepID=A0ACC2R276_9NEOP|nr:hypothetical protein PYW08_001328 [Mythimna loreyi]
MFGLRFCLLLAVICSCSQFACGRAEPPALTQSKTVLLDVDPPKQEKEPEVTVETTTAPVPTPSPSPAPTTTTSTPAPTTTSSTTTTTTTTPAPSPSPAPKPTPAPTPAPAPAPAPGPLPPPDQGTWALTDPKTNVTCIVVQFAAQLNVTYTIENSTSASYVVLNVPANAKVAGGNCSSADQWIQVSWLSNNTLQPNNMTLVYHRNETTKNYGLQSLNISLSPENLVNGSSKDPLELYHGAEWQTPLATSYRCKSSTLLNMTASGNNAAVLTVSRLQEEAYRTTNGTGFSAARECGGGDVPDAVPIAVGCALGGLVVVVLVAYLVGRRRSAARGYLSM